MKDSLITHKAGFAGSFYSKNPRELKNQLQDLFSKARPHECNDVIAIITPHAGYQFSGVVAASAFNQIDTTKSYDNIFVIASSHRHYFNGGSIYSVGNFETPLGEVKVNLELSRKLKKENKVFSFSDSFHNSEHALEVELPFLQYIMKKDYRIVPIMTGTDDAETCREMAKALKPWFNSNNLFIISSDFSHYPPYDEAERVDRNTADAILSNSPTQLMQVMKSNKAPALATSLCSWTSVMTLLYLSEGNPDISTKLIQYQNSGDTPEGGKESVVGYNAIAFSLKNTKKQGTAFINLTLEEKQQLLGIARNSIEKYLGVKGIDETDYSKLSKNLSEQFGAFVTLYKEGDLRGCIGRFTSDEPLYKVISEMAVTSATKDYRFPQVTLKELKDIRIEISVISPMKKISNIDEIEMGKHGVYIVKGQNNGTFLPQVAKETHWTKEEFLGHCARDKAGIGWDGWKDADIFIYEVVAFEE